MMPLGTLAAMAEVVIRSGTVVDGSGGPPRIADVAIDDGVVVEVGDVTGRGRREIDAAGQSRAGLTFTRTTTARPPGIPR